MLSNEHFQSVLLGVAGLTLLAAALFALLALLSLRRMSDRKVMLRRSAMNREIFGAMNIPYTAHAHENVVKTKAGDYVQAFRLAGASFQSADDADINNWHERLNILLRNIASDQVSLWTHIVRRRENVYPSGECPPGFSREVDEHYRERVTGETLMVNELYLSVVFRPQAGMVQGAAMKLLSRSNKDNEAQEFRDSLDACAKLRAQLSGLARSIRTGTLRDLRERRPAVLLPARIFRRALERRMATGAPAARLDQRGAPDHTAVLRLRSHGIPHADSDAPRRILRDQGVPDPDQRRHVQSPVDGARTRSCSPRVSRSCRNPPLSGSYRRSTAACATPRISRCRKPNN